MPPLPPLIQERLSISTEVAPGRSLPRKYRRILARVVEADLAWLRDHPDSRARVRRYVRGEFFPMYLQMTRAEWVAVVFEPFYAGPLGYLRYPLWEAVAAASQSQEVN